MPPDAPIELSWISTAADIVARGGLPVIVVIMGLIIRVLWNELRDKDKVIGELQDKRAADALDAVKATATTLTASTLHISTNTVALQDIARLQQSGLDVLRLLPGTLDGIAKGQDRDSNKIEVLAGRLPR